MNDTVKHSHIQIATDLGRSWCGEMLGSEFYFDDAEKAALSGKYKTTHLVCESCIAEILKGLTHDDFEKKAS